jgi:hypothetical protein
LYAVKKLNDEDLTKVIEEFKSVIINTNLKKVKCIFPKKLKNKKGI